MICSLEVGELTLGKQLSIQIILVIKQWLMPITYVLILLIHGLLGIGQDRVVSLVGCGVLMMGLICIFGIQVTSM
jgi:hypothetical protein